MKNIFNLLIIFLLTLLYTGCGTSDKTPNDTLKKGLTQDGDINVNDEGVVKITEKILKDVVEMPKSIPCEDGEFYRLKTKECLPIKNISWGFQGFAVPSENVYNLDRCTQDALQSLIDNLPKEGGKIIMPECTIETVNGIELNSSVILEGAGTSKTILSNRGESAIHIIGKDVIIRNFTIDGNLETLNGVDGRLTKGNTLIEFIEAKNFNQKRGAGISFLTKRRFHDPKLTVRYCTTLNSLHGINIKVMSTALAMVYSNQSYANRNYGIDLSTNYRVEVAGNYLHNNEEAGVKSPNASYINYHHNDMNFNKKAGIVYHGGSGYGLIRVENNDLSDNGGMAFAARDTRLFNLYLTNNIVTNSVDLNGYAIGVKGVRNVHITGNHGRVWTGDNNYSKVIYY